MTEEQKLDFFRKFKGLNVAGYTTKYGNYYGLMFAGAEIATKELKEENAVVEKENAELKEKNKWYSEQVCNKECAEVWGQLTKAKEIIKNIIRVTWGEGFNYSFDWKVKAEQFLKEVSK